MRRASAPLTKHRSPGLDSIQPDLGSVLSVSPRLLGNLRDRTFEARVNKYAAIWNAPRSAEVVVPSVNLALAGANGPGTAVSPPAPTELSSQTAPKTPVATPSVAPLPQEPPPVRDAAETPVEAPASVAPLPPHRPPQVGAATPRAVAPQP
jgi:hypothetical protein